MLFWLNSVWPGTLWCPPPKKKKKPSKTEMSNMDPDKTSIRCMMVPTRAAHLVSKELQARQFLKRWAIVIRRTPDNNNSDLMKDKVNNLQCNMNKVMVNPLNISTIYIDIYRLYVALIKKRKSFPAFKNRYVKSYNMPITVTVNGAE